MYNMKLILMTYPGHMIKEKVLKISYGYLVVDSELVQINKISLKKEDS
jgi:hypothetical protein